MTLDAVTAANRFGLGARPGELERARDDARGWLQKQLTGSRAAPEEIRRLPSSAEIFKTYSELRRDRNDAKGDSAAAKRLLGGLRAKLVPYYLDQVAARYRVAAHTEESFRERLVHFWTNHFAVSADKPQVLALAGALLFSFLGLTTLNIYSQVGLITLVGLIAKNGILIVQFANVLQERGWAKLAALREASLTRLRPVLMTSAATVFGHFPLVLATGPGSAARNSIGTVLVAGMSIGTVFTLFVVPVFYSLIAAEHRPGTAREEVEEAVPLPEGAVPA